MTLPPHLGDEPLETALPTRRRKRKAPQASERSIQIAIKSRLAFHGIVCLHIPNEGRRSKAAGFRLRQEGMIAGAPDLICIGAGGRVAWLEVKRADGRVAPAQAAFHDTLRDKGHLVAVVRSQDEAVDTLRAAGWFR
jgi:hypothetical protein